MEEDANSTGCYFYWSRSKKVCLAFPFLLGILQSSTLRTVRAGAVKRPPCMICCAVKDSFNTNRQVCSLLPSIKPTLKKVSKYENKFAKLQKKVSLCSELNFNLYLYLIFRPLSSASEPSWRLWRRKSLPWTRARQRQVNSHFLLNPTIDITIGCISSFHARPLSGRRKCQLVDPPQSSIFYPPMPWFC